MKRAEVGSPEAPGGVDVVTSATQRRPRFNSSLDLGRVRRRPIADGDLAEMVDACGAGGRARASPAFTRARARRLEYLRAGLDEWGSVGMVARDGSVLAGFLEVRPLAGHPLARLYPARDAVLLNCARYHPGFGMGVRRLLVADLVEQEAWPRLPGAGRPDQLLVSLSPSAAEEEVAFYLGQGFQEAAVTIGVLPGYRVFALPLRPRRLERRVLPTAAGVNDEALQVPRNPLCHLSLWSAAQLRLAAEQLGLEVRERDFLPDWPLPAPVAVLAGAPVADLDHRPLDVQEAMVLLERALGRPRAV